MQDAATAVTQFRRHCLAHSLLDLSLAVQMFDTQLVKHPEFHRYFRERFRHLIVDNIEEQTPAGQNFVTQLMDSTQTTAVAYDDGGGYKRFMAADPSGAKRLRLNCKLAFDFTQNFVAAPEMTALANLVDNFLLHTNLPTLGAERRWNGW